MNTLALLLPTYKRPQTLQRVADNIAATTKNSYTLYFGVEADDEASKVAALLTGHPVVVNRYSNVAGYSNTIQSIYEVSAEPFLFHANDDFEFLPGWDVVPLAMFDTPSVGVVGVPQNDQDHDCSAVCFIRRSYIEERSGVVDIPNRVFYPYHHNYQDTEFTLTARSRGVWAKSDVPCINHLHPGIIGGEKDETYKKNDATAGRDEATFNSRKHLW